MHDGVVQKLAKHSRCLEVLHLSYCPHITDKSMEALGGSNSGQRDQGCFNLGEISVVGCIKVTAEGLKKLAEGTRMVKHVYVTNPIDDLQEIRTAFEYGLDPAEVVVQAVDPGKFSRACLVVLSAHVPARSQIYMPARSLALPRPTHWPENHPEGRRTPPQKRKYVAGCQQFSGTHLVPRHTQERHFNCRRQGYTLTARRRLVFGRCVPALDTMMWRKRLLLRALCQTSDINGLCLLPLPLG